MKPACKPPENARGSEGKPRGNPTVRGVCGGSVSRVRRPGRRRDGVVAWWAGWTSRRVQLSARLRVPRVRGRARGACRVAAGGGEAEPTPSGQYGERPSGLDHIVDAKPDQIAPAQLTVDGEADRDVRPRICATKMAAPCVDNCRRRQVTKSLCDSSPRSFTSVGIVTLSLCYQKLEMIG
jgi:hypothetical protein